LFFGILPKNDSGRPVRGGQETCARSGGLLPVEQSPDCDQGDHEVTGQEVRPSSSALVQPLPDVQRERQKGWSGAAREEEHACLACPLCCGEQKADRREGYRGVEQEAGGVDCAGDQPAPSQQNKAEEQQTGLDEEGAPRCRFSPED